jgi:hypothetical protein
MPQTKRTAVWETKEHPTVYANMMGIGMTPFDINVVFGEILHSDDKTLTGTPRVKVLLTPEQAQNLVKLLTVALNTYVKTNGAVRAAGAVNVVDFAESFEAATIALGKIT